MTKYKCTQTFRSVYGKQYNYGTVISSYEYQNLKYPDNLKFIMVMEESSGYSSGPDLSINPLGSIGGLTDFSSGLDSYSGSSDSGSSSNDFGGGDFGGGGSSGEW